MMERRHFLCALVCGVTLAHLPGDNFVADSSGWQDLKNIHPDVDIRRLAEHYKVFLSGKGLDIPLSVYDNVSQAVARDFDNGLVVRIDGWLYSRTELYLCAVKVGLLYQIMES